MLRAPHNEDREQGRDHNHHHSSKKRHPKKKLRSNQLSSRKLPKITKNTGTNNNINKQPWKRRKPRMKRSFRRATLTSRTRLATSTWTRRPRG